MVYKTIDSDQLPFINIIAKAKQAVVQLNAIRLYFCKRVTVIFKIAYQLLLRHIYIVYGSDAGFLLSLLRRDNRRFDRIFFTDMHDRHKGILAFPDAVDRCFEVTLPD